MGLHIEGLYLENGNGRIFRFDDAAEKLLTGRFGFGMPPVSNRTRRAPYQQGESFISSTVTPRVINLTTSMLQCTRQELFLLRQELIRTNNPFASDCANPMKLVWVWPGDKKKYYLNVYYTTGLEMNTASGPSPLVQNTGIQLVAYDPFWYAWGEEEETYSCPAVVCTDCGDSCPTYWFFGAAGAGSPTGMLSFPLTSFGACKVDTTLNCVNSGDIPVYPTITVNGPFSSPRIENLETGKYILWDNTISTADDLVIDCDAKTVELNGVSAIGYKSLGSTFISLLPAAMGVTDGINRIAIYGTQLPGSTGITITWRNQFIGF